MLTLLDLVQLSGLEKRYPGQLSGGQRQRVALARALAIEPRMLLLDEPFGALDAKVRRELRRWLREIHDRTGHTTVFVTHDQEEAMELADRVVVLNQGRIEQIGSADEIYDAPASPFVFSFIGESSALPVTVQGGRVLLADLPLELGVASAADGPAMLHFRPHDAAIGKPARLGHRRHRHFGPPSWLDAAPGACGRRRWHAGGDRRAPGFSCAPGRKRCLHADPLAPLSGSVNDACSSFAVGASKHVVRTVPVSITDRAGEPARVEDRTDLLLPRLLQSRPRLNQHAGALCSDRLQKRSRGVANLLLQCLVLIELVVAC